MINVDTNKAVVFCEHNTNTLKTVFADSYFGLIRGFVGFSKLTCMGIIWGLGLIPIAVNVRPYDKAGFLFD